MTEVIALMDLIHNGAKIKERASFSVSERDARSLCASKYVRLRKEPKPPKAKMKAEDK